MSNKNTEISERIKNLLIILELNANSFAKALGYERSQAVYDMLNGKAAPSFDFFSKILNSEYSDKINIQWIIDGKGEPLLNTAPDKEKKRPVQSHDGVPLIPASALAGIGEGALTIMDHEVDQRYVIPEFSKADFLIRVKGSSMYPKYSAGDLLACIRIPKDRFIQWNKTYVLDTTQGIMVKRILKGSQPGQWILRSDNKDYQDIEVHPDKEIYSISLVIGVIRLE